MHSLKIDCFNLLFMFCEVKGREYQFDITVEVAEIIILCSPKAQI